MPPPQRRGAQSLNLWAGRLIPLVVLGVNAYAIYVVTKVIGIDFCIKPADEWDPLRRGAGIAIIVLQWILFTFTFAAWLRFAIALFSNPGYVPLGKKPKRRRRRSTSRRPGSRGSARSPTRSKEKDDDLMLDRSAVRDGQEPCPPGLEQFYNKEIFSCGLDGVPRWCNYCWNWKPDRTRHCGEIGRCIRRFDHYCPWVGGAVSETNNKFFIQFTFYASWYALFILAVCIWALIQAHKDFNNNNPNDGSSYEINGHYIVGIAFAAVFAFMALGIVFRFGYFILVNRTTIEDLGKGNPNYCIAVRINESELPRATQSTNGRSTQQFWVVPYPFPSQRVPQEQEARRQNEYLYAILFPRSGANLWDLGWYRNWKEIMGNSVMDWFLPLKYSPCIKHDDGVSEYALGADFELLERTFLPHRYDQDGKRLVPLDERLHNVG